MESVEKVKSAFSPLSSLPKQRKLKTVSFSEESLSITNQNENISRNLPAQSPDSRNSRRTATESRASANHSKLSNESRVASEGITVTESRVPRSVLKESADSEKFFISRDDDVA